MTYSRKSVSNEDTICYLLQRANKNFEGVLLRTTEDVFLPKDQFKFVQKQLKLLYSKLNIIEEKLLEHPELIKRSYEKKSSKYTTVQQAIRKYYKC